jgi:serine/threonine protein kinase
LLFGSENFMSLPDPLIGRIVDGYRIEKLLGRGGMARVYRAVDEALARFVALKIIDPHSSKDTDYRERFRNEARAIAQLRHPNIVGIYRFGEVDQLYYMAMDYIDGSDLRWVLESYGKSGELMPYESVYRIISQVGKALDYAHKQGVIHRDIKPSNIMLNQDSEAILTDFGLALVTDEGTKGNTFGSPHYIAPEQAIASSGAVRQSDLYSLGVTLYEMLTGRVPFAEGSALQIAMAQMTDPPPDPLQFNPSLHPAFLPILKTALEKEPENRFQSGAKMAAALRAAVNEAKKTPVETRTKPIRPVKSSSTNSPVLQLSHVEIPAKIAEYRQENPITTVPGVKPEAIPVRRRRRRLPIMRLILLVAFISITSAYIALNLELMKNYPAVQPNSAGVSSSSPSPAVFEGVVRAIEGAVLTLYDVPVALPADEPLLQKIKTGDVVRIEGSALVEADGRVTFTRIQAKYLNGEPTH